MWWLFLIIGCFGLGAVLGAPWLPTRNRELKAALELLALPSGATVVDLGSGSGSFALVAARSGLKVVGYEINPLLWLYARVRLWPYRRQVHLRLANYWSQPLPPCQGVYVFLIKRYMNRLEAKLTAELATGTKVVSYVFRLPRKKPQVTSQALTLYQF